MILAIGIKPTHIIIILLIIIIGFLLLRPKIESNEISASETKKTKRKRTPISGESYQQKWMFTYNEKDGYKRLKPIADKLGYILFAKVRLLDLVEPKKGTKQYKTLLYKVQSKHVDFVLCDQNLVAKCIIELDDKSHERQDRKERDKFVDEVVTSTGYKILHLHLHEINENIKQQIQ